MKKLIICSVALLLALCLSLSCFAESGAWPVTILDQAGRLVTIEKEPETIISGYYIATSMLIGLGQADKLIGVENDAQSRPVYALSAPQLLELPALGTVKTFDLELCAALNPDLVILPLKLSEMAPNLEALGFTVVFVNPESQALLEEAIILLGTATGSSLRGGKMLDFIHTQLDRLDAALSDSEQPRVYFSGNSSFLKTAGPAMYQHTLLANAGAENVAQALSDTYWAEISYEQLLAWNPEHIVLAANAKYTADDLAADPALAGCSTVADGRIHQIPGTIESWDSPVPGSFLGSLYLASVLHPDLYTQSDYAAAVAGFYKSFYGFSPEL